MKKVAFLVLLTLQLVQNAGIENIFYYHNNIRCEKCERGQKVKEHCTIDLHPSECVACEEGTFADRYSSSKLCEQCTDCSHTDQIIKKNCTPEKNTECKCPDKKYHSLGFCRACNPPKIKRVRDEREYCEDCEYGSYFNNTVEDCVKCDICTGDQVAWRVCNVTHNTQCKQLPTTTEKNEDDLSGSKIANIASGVIGVMIVLLIIILIIVLMKKKLCSFRENANRESGSQTSQSSDKSSLEKSITKSLLPNQTLKRVPDVVLSSKPIWMHKMRKILIDNLDQLDIFVAHLGTSEFNSKAKWEQLTGHKIETRIFKFMDVWYEQTSHPSLKQIISALQEMDKNDIVNMIQNDVNLNEQLRTENIRNKDLDVP